MNGKPYTHSVTKLQIIPRIFNTLEGYSAEYYAEGGITYLDIYEGTRLLRSHEFYAAKDPRRIVKGEFGAIQVSQGVLQCDKHFNAYTTGGTSNDSPIPQPKSRG